MIRFNSNSNSIQINSNFTDSFGTLVTVTIMAMLILIIMVTLVPDVNWLTQFPWLEFRNVSDQILMFCTVCSRIGKDNNIFVKGTNQYRKDYLVHHNNQPKHISNLDLIKNQRKIFTLFSKTQIKKIQNNNNN